MTADGAVVGGGLTRCLIADDQAMVREGFAAVLAAQPDLVVVGQAADGADAVRQALHLQPDVVLMDVRMPVMDGLQATREILRAAASPDRPRVLMLTTFDLDDYVYRALRAGASGFLLKDATSAELINAVRVVAAGDALLAPSVTRRLIADFARQPHADPPFPPTTLSALRVAGYGASGRGWRAKSAMSRRVTDGASSASPAATTRTAWTRSAAVASLSRKPLAPARSAS